MNLFTLQSLLKFLIMIFTGNHVKKHEIENRNHANRTLNSRLHNLRITPERYFRFH